MAQIDETPGRRNLRRKLNRFVTATEDRGSTEAAKVYRTSVEEFLIVTGKTFAEYLTADDIAGHLRALQKRGLANRTIANQHGRVLAFLRYLKLDTKGLAPYKPRYEEWLPEVYGTEELRTLTGDPGAGTGGGTRIDLDRGILRVRSNPKHGYCLLFQAALLFISLYLC